MWRKMVLLLALGLVAVGCGAEEGPEAFTGVARELPEPKSSGWGTSEPAGVQAETSATPSTSAAIAVPTGTPDGVFIPVQDGICAVFLAVMLTSPETFGSDDAANAAYRSALEPIGAEAAALLDEVRGGSTGPDRLWQALTQLDEITLAGCAIPFTNAQIILAAYDVEGASSGWPSIMPCFAPTGDALSASTLSYAPVDCGTGQSVTWRDGRWQVGA